MADWPIYQQARIATVGQNASTSAALTITAAGSTNTKGSWTQLVSSTAFAASGFILNLLTTGTQRFLFDIGIGAAASEVVLVPDLHVCSLTADHLGVAVHVPVSIPAGVRIAARCQSSSASATGKINLMLLGGGTAYPPGLSTVTTYGASSGTSGGTAVDPGTTANTKGSWTQITSSTTADHKALMLAYGSGGASSPGQQGSRVDIGVGAAASETVIVPDFQVQMNFGGWRLPSFSPTFPVDIPSGSRLAVRIASEATGSSRLGEIVLYGMS